MSGERIGWIIAAVVIALGAAAHADPCVDAKVATERQDAADKANEASFAKALAARGMKPIALRQITVAEDRDEESERLRNYHDNRVADVTVAGAKFHVITEHGMTRCFDGHFEWAQQGTKIYRIMRRPTQRTLTNVAACGCYLPADHVPMCGGVVPLAAVFGFVLPDRATFEGFISIEYVIDALVVRGTAECPRGQSPP